MFPINAPISAPKPVAIPDRITYSITLNGLIPPFFIGTAMLIPSGTSCKHIAIASDNPKEVDESNPEPIAKPSGMLWSASPILTIIPVFNNPLFLAEILLFSFNFAFLEFLKE